MNPGPQPELKRALLLAPAFERAVREASRLLREAGIRHALVGALGASAYRSPLRTTADIEFLVGAEAFQHDPGGLVTMRVPIVTVDGIDVHQVPLADALRVVEDGLTRASVSDGVPIAPVDTIVVMKLLASRHQDLADVEAIVAQTGSSCERPYRRRRRSARRPWSGCSATSTGAADASSLYGEQSYGREIRLKALEVGEVRGVHDITSARRRRHDKGVDRADASHRRERLSGQPGERGCGVLHAHAAQDDVTHV